MEKGVAAGLIPVSLKFERINNLRFQDHTIGFTLLFELVHKDLFDDRVGFD